MTDTFAPGDRVEAIAESYGPDRVPVGSLGYVIRPLPGNAPWAYVGFDHDRVGDGNGGWSMAGYQLRIITEQEHRPMTTRQALALWARIGSSIAAHAVGRHAWSCRGRYCLTREA